MTLTPEMLDALRPMHLWFDRDGAIRRSGPTLRKLLAPRDPQEHQLLELFEPLRPRGIGSVADLIRHSSRGLRLRLRHRPGTIFVGHAVPDGAGGGVLDLSFGISVAEALRHHTLTGADFPPTDQTVELLFLIESKSAAMESAIRLNNRFQSARLAAEARAKTDPLTNLLNRRGAEEELDRLSATGVPFAVIQIDLDRFKLVNDGEGHAAGDRVLRIVAGHLGRCTRLGDTAARLGGDEFLLILPDPPGPDELIAAGKRLIRQIETPIQFRGTSLSVSASLGIAYGGGVPGAESRSVVDAADAALYAAKGDGRARVALAPGNAFIGTKRDAS
ncbi:diguanylate cyclase [Roseivivax halodurans JCM 10272]|uniref:diguanylate cyclase n=1 Tax=Roseivivax halodurans JCM 10272 TaxID=1449350 RepID=X7EHZ6_9RHOB|nr:GGDEF domain-containing protein [Roseivivax halodurans]ETX14763.1 diguanylate cyclase [Roseivivax halodurans JCM 10272]